MLIEKQSNLDINQTKSISLLTPGIISLSPPPPLQSNIWGNVIEIDRALNMI